MNMLAHMSIVVVVALTITGNILDIILSNSNDLVTNLSIASDNSCISSDHFAITFELAQQVFQTFATTLKYVYDFPKANYNGIQTYLLDFDYSTCLQSQDTETIWHTII